MQDEAGSAATGAFTFSPGLRAGYLAYQLVAHLLVPAALLLVLWRGQREPMYRRRLPDRLGLSRPGAPGAIWVFAASLGETRAVAPLVRELLARGHDILLTHSSPAGLAEGGRLFAAEIAAARLRQAYGPLDLHLAVRAFLRRHRPALGLVVESEVWPAQLVAARAQGVPMVVINGNLTARALARDSRGPGRLRLAFFRAFTLALTKSPAHVARYVAAGIAPAQVHDVGELKFDLPVDDAQIAAARRIGPTLRAGRAVLMIASSVEDEEEALVTILRRLFAGPAPAPLVIWVPRSPQRFAAVAARTAAEGWHTACRSALLDAGLALRDGAAPSQAPQVIVGDSLGEMDFYYALADLVFVGATLNDLGGHNIIEPLAQDKPVITGPSIYGIAFPAEEARAAGALRVLPDAAALGDELCRLFASTPDLATFRIAAQGFNTAHRGAARRSADLLEPLLAR